MDILNLWLPLIGGGLLCAIAIGAWFANQKLVGTWFGFAGLVCLLLLATLQLQETLLHSRVEEDPNRPWVGVHSINIAPLESANYNARVRFINVGRTPARQVYVVVNWIIPPSSDRPPAIPASVARDSPANIFLPNVEYPVDSFQEGLMTKEFIDAIRKGERIIWITGRAEYVDAQGSPRHYSFRAKYLPSSNGFGIEETDAN